MRDDPVNERWKRLVALTTQFLEQESPADRNGVQYAIPGSVASSVYGEPVASADGEWHG